MGQESREIKTLDTGLRRYDRKWPKANSRHSSESWGPWNDEMDE